MRDLDAFPHHTVRVLRQVVPAEWVWYDAADPTKGRTTWVVEPFDTFRGAQRVFSQHMHEHPCFLHPAQISDGRCWRLSDFLSRSRLHRLNLYNEYYRRRGIEYQLGLRLTASGQSVIAVGVNRSAGQKDFSDDNVLCMNLLGPHLIEAYRNAEALTDLRRELEHAGRVEHVHRGVVMLRKAGVQFVSRRAHELIEQYVGWPRGRAHTLPDVLSAWMAYEESQLARDDKIPAPRHPLVLTRGDHQLRVRLLTHPEQNLMLFDDRSREGGPFNRAKLGLTTREAEVLAWVARGKTNEDTATILGIRSATIAKHLEHIFRKLGVETRTAAAARAFETTN